MTTLASPPARSLPALTHGDADQHFVIRDVAWSTYVAIGRLFADRPAMRMTFDRGILELRTISPRHERYKRWLGRFIETIAEELNKPIMPGGSMTFQREELERGFEADDCFWIANESAVRAKLTWDPAKDPPPDVALEIEVSRSAVDRMAIYRAFRIPEVWCFDEKKLRIYILQPDGSYLLSDHSLAFPGIPLHELVHFFPMVEQSGYLGTVAAVRAWVRSLINKP